MAEAEEHLLTCAECGRVPHENENAADEWRAYRDISDELPVFRPECAASSAAPSSRANRPERLAPCLSVVSMKSWSH
jgi:hypothetical protein